MNDLEASGWNVWPTSRSITYASGGDESALDYWLTTSQTVISDVSVGGSLVAQHRPITALIQTPSINGKF
jgi:hypothetical protein